MMLSWFKPRGQLSTMQPLTRPFPLRTGKEKMKQKGSGIEIRTERGGPPTTVMGNRQTCYGKKKNITLIQNTNNNNT